ncbi:MAG TPA: DUF1513 domain-containing protein [Candidatus Kapabacteria bacterium]|nr:DUF1513 domain-containing protein [Candidatus Kapabacteria bacterium]
MQRRRFLQGMLGTLAATGLPVSTLVPLMLGGCQREPLLPGTLLSACDDARGNHFVASIQPDGSLGFQIPVPLRAHDSCASRERDRALFFARRPGHQIYVVDLHERTLIQTLDAEPGRHFYGHGVISADGQWLFTTEQIYATGQGMIGVYRMTHPIRRETEFPSHGMDPHQLQWLSDGETLVIANGGILTHPDQNRENLNPDTMQPALTYVRVRDGALLESRQPPHHQMSLHHLDVSPQDQVVVGVQHQGALTDEVALVGSHRRGSDMQWWRADELTQLRMQQYTASVAVNSNGRQAVVSCPRGNGITVWDMQSGQLIRMLDITDAAGVRRQPQQAGWVGTNGAGALVRIDSGAATVALQTLRQYPLRWDNHATLI